MKLPDGRTKAWRNGCEGSNIVRSSKAMPAFNRPRVVVNDDVLQADKIFINVEVAASVPAMPGIQDVPFLTNSSMMDVDFLPEHLVIIGGSYIGLEFGQMYRRFGSEVTIVEMGSRLIGREDEDISEAVRQILEAEGIQIRLNAKCISLAKRNSGIAVGMGCDEGPPEVVGTHVLLAVDVLPTRTTWVSIGPGLRSINEATSSLTINCKPTCPAFGPWVTATVAAPLLIRLTTIMRSLRTISSTETIAACQTESDVRSLYRSAIRPVRNDGRRNTKIWARRTHYETSDESSGPGYGER